MNIMRRKQGSWVKFGSSGKLFSLLSSLPLLFHVHMNPRDGQTELFFEAVPHDPVFLAAVLLSGFKTFLVSLLSHRGR